MLGIIAFGAKWVWAGIAGYIIAWWFWPALGLGLGIAAFLLLPAGVSFQLRQLLAIALVATGAALGTYSLGNENGIALMQETVERAKEAERTRLTEGFAKERLKEASRTVDAQAAVGRLQQELEDVIATTTEGAGPIGPPEPQGNLQTKRAGAGVPDTGVGLCRPGCIALDRGTVDRLRGWSTRRSPRSP